MKILENVDNLIMELARWKKQALLTRGGTEILGKSINHKSNLYRQQRLSKDALQRLENLGIKKSYDEYVKGFNTGTYAKAKKANAKIIPDNKSTINTSGWDVQNFGTSNQNNLPMNITLNKQGQTNPLIGRHEADEAVETKRIIKKFPATGVSNSITYFTNKKTGNLVGMHASEKILQNEARNRELLYSLYGNRIRSINKPHDIYRKNSNEYSKKILTTPKSEIDRRFAQNNITIDERFRKGDPKIFKRFNTLQKRGDKIAQYTLDSAKRGESLSDGIKKIIPIKTKIDKQRQAILDLPQYQSVSKIAKVTTT